MPHYIYLTGSIIFEIFATTMLKYSEGFTNLWPSIGVLIGYSLAFYFLSLTLKTFPLGLAYAIWSGVGTACTAVIGIVLWHDPFNFYTFMGLSLIILGVALLNKKDRTENKVFSDV